MANLFLALKILFALFNFFNEKDKETKKAKRRALQKILDGVESNDPSAVTAGFDNLNRL